MSTHVTIQGHRVVTTARWHGLALNNVIVRAWTVDGDSLGHTPVFKHVYTHVADIEPDTCFMLEACRQKALKSLKIQLLYGSGQ